MNMASRTLLVVGDRIEGPVDVAAAPRRDYDALAQALSADVLHAGALKRRWGRSIGGFALARLAAARAVQYANVYCDSEHIGLPLALMLPRAPARPRLTMIAHYLSPLKKQALIRALGLVRRIDCLVVHSQAQLARARALGFSYDQIALLPYHVDTTFWRPADAAPAHIASAGQEFRDYLTLMRAVRDLPVRVRIAAGSNWSARRPTYRKQDVPETVTLGRLSYRELRDVYAAAHVVVVPLMDVDFQAGIITILEAMAMGKCVVVSRTMGQRGIVSGPLMEKGRLVDVGERRWPEPTGIYVPAGDVPSLREAVTYLLERPDVARQMGAAGRRFVESDLSLERFVERMCGVIAPEAATANALQAGATR